MPDLSLPPALNSHGLLVAAVIVHDRADRRVLLLQRAEGAKFAPLLWDLPVGKVDKGEPITTSAVRELAEETGVIVEPSHLAVAAIIHGAWGVEAPLGFLTVVFTADQWAGAPVNAEPSKHAQVTWVGVDRIPAEFVSTTRTVLVHCLNGGKPQVFTDGF